MRYGLLGSFEVAGSELPARIRPGKPAALLALLLVERNRVVSADRLIDGLWGDRPPQTARKTLQLYVSQLRKALPPGTLETRSGGYVLHVAAGELDIDRFAELAEAGRTAAEAHEHEAASRRLHEALGLWRGPALVDFEHEAFARAEIRRLDKLRLAALEQRIDADLAIGRQARLAPELEQLVDAHPTRERFRAQLMLALYRCGRQADALAAYREGRRVLNEELGIEPGVELRELERAILEHDPSLAATPSSPSSPSSPRRRDRGRWGYAVAGAGLVVAVLAWVLAGRGPSSHASPAAGNSALELAVDGSAGRPVPVDDSPGHVVRLGGDVWTSNELDGTVSRIDPATRSVSSFPVGRSPEGMAVAAGDLWVALAGDGKVVAVDPRSGTAVRSVAVGNGPVAVAARGGRVWVANGVDGTLVTVAARSGAIMRTTAVGIQPTAVVADRSAVWVALAGSSSVVELDRDGGAPLQSIAVGADPVALAEAGGRVWVANHEDDTVTRFDAATGRVEATYPVGGSPTDVSVAGRTVWVTLAAGRVVRLDARSGTLLGSTSVGGRPAAVSAGRPTWVALVAQPQAHRGGTLRVETDSFFGIGGKDCRCADPLDAYTPDGWGLLHLAYDGLLAYRNAAGPSGATLVGDLAQSVPRPSADGLTYVFRLRPGVRFSNGRPVRPSDVRASFVRFFTVEHDDYMPPFFTRVAGATRCAATHRCAGLGIVADDRTGTVTIHLDGSDPNFLYELALPPAYVLPSSLGRRVARTAPPGTGPYRIASYRAPRGTAHPGRLVFVRNPYFEPADRESTSSPDRIVATLGSTPAQQVAAVEHGTADVVSGTFPASIVHDLAVRYTSRIHLDSYGQTDYMFLNTRVSPFDHVAARRALNDAVDRTRLVRLLGGADAVRPTCQILPPDFPGYRPYCPYGLDPSGAGTWTGPNLARATALVRASGTRGERVLVWAPATHANVARYFASVLDQIGYRATARIVGSSGSSSYYDAVGAARTGAQIGWAGWIKDYISPEDFVVPLFACSGISTPASTTNDSRFCDPVLERQIAHAESVQQVDTVAGQAAWGAADRRIVDAAAAVPYANDLTLTLLSNRTRNYQFNPEWGVLLDQLWVR